MWSVFKSMFQETDIAIQFLAFIPNMIVAIAGWRKRRVLSVPGRIILLFVFHGLFTELTVRLLNLNGIPNMFLIPYYVLIQFSLISYYFCTIYKRKMLKRFALSCYVIFTFYWILHLLFFQDDSRISNYLSAVEGLLVITFLFGHLYDSFGDIKFKTPFFFCINTGFFIYFCGSMLLFLFGNFTYLLPEELLKFIWMLHALLVIVLYSLLGFGLWKDSQQTKPLYYSQ